MLGDASPIGEREAALAVGLGELGFSCFAAWGCRKGVTLLAEIIENFVLTLLKEERIFHHAPDLVLRVSLNHYIEEKTAIKIIEFCKESGKSAVTIVAVAETVTQLIKLYNKDEQHWALDILSGQYRGAALGAIAGLFESYSGTYVEKFFSAVVGYQFGRVLGGVIAGVGSAARSGSSIFQRTKHALNESS